MVKLELGVWVWLSVWVCEAVRKCVRVRASVLLGTAVGEHVSVTDDVLDMEEEMVFMLDTDPEHVADLGEEVDVDTVQLRVEVDVRDAVILIVTDVLAVQDDAGVKFFECVEVAVVVWTCGPAIEGVFEAVHVDVRLLIFDVVSVLVGVPVGVSEIAAVVDSVREDGAVSVTFGLRVDVWGRVMVEEREGVNVVDGVSVQDAVGEIVNVGEKLSVVVWELVRVLVIVVVATPVSVGVCVAVVVGDTVTVEYVDIVKEDEWVCFWVAVNVHVGEGEDVTVFVIKLLHVSVSDAVGAGVGRRVGVLEMEGVPVSSGVGDVVRDPKGVRVPVGVGEGVGDWVVVAVCSSEWELVWLNVGVPVLRGVHVDE
jgi:hypothetical protein